ncbi:MAG: FlgD immunoglobulin-like domain containing protein [Fibrobacterota bacterium]
MKRPVSIPLLLLLIYNFSSANSDWYLRIPNGAYVYTAGRTRCQICHEYAAPTGTSKQLNAFGSDFLSAGTGWNLGLASTDSDGDGFSNEIELSCHNYSWIPSMGSCGSDLSSVTNPGDPDVKPGIAVEKRPGTPTDAARLNAAPNPFNPGTSLSFHLSHTPREGLLTILSADGRTIRTIRLSGLEMAMGKTAWDGRNNKGTPTAAGVYTAVLTAAGQRLTARLTLLR